MLRNGGISPEVAMRMATELGYRSSADLEVRVTNSCSKVQGLGFRSQHPKRLIEQVAWPAPLTHVPYLLHPSH